LHAFLSDGQVHGVGRRRLLVLMRAILAAPLQRYSCRN
jgi:hypothetical protein